MRILATRSLVFALLAAGCGSSTPSSSPVDQSTSSGTGAGHSGAGGSSGSGGESGSSSGAGSGAATPPSSGMASSGSSMDHPMGGSGSPDDSGALLDGSTITVPSDGGMADAMWPPRADLGKGDGTDVINIGDSWMLLSTTGIELSLVRLSMQPYREYAVPGTELLTGQIPSQYTQAKAANANIKTVIMTGGGNDVILTGMSADCAAGGSNCQMTLTKIGAALATLWKQMSADGVQDVIHIEYAAVAGAGLKDPAANERALQTICNSVPLPIHCHLLNTDPYVMKTDLMADGIHPSGAACDRIAMAVMNMMVAGGMRR
jgi:hypothetical protein